MPLYAAAITVNCVLTTAGIEHIVSTCKSPFNGVPWKQIINMSAFPVVTHLKDDRLAPEILKFWSLLLFSILFSCRVHGCINDLSAMLWQHYVSFNPKKTMDAHIYIVVESLRWAWAAFVQIHMLELCLMLSVWQDLRKGPTSGKTTFSALGSNSLTCTYVYKAIQISNCKCTYLSSGRHRTKYISYM